MSKEQPTAGAASNFEAREAEEQERAKKIYDGMRGVLEADDIMALTTIMRDILTEGGRDYDPEAYFKRYERQNPKMRERSERLYSLLQKVNGLSLRDEHIE